MTAFSFTTSLPERSGRGRKFERVPTSGRTQNEGSILSQNGARVVARATLIRLAPRLGVVKTPSFVHRGHLSRQT